MVSKHLRFLSQWRRPLQRFDRGRLWKIYDRNYDALLGHARLHSRWFEENLPPSGLGNILSIGPGQGVLELELCQKYGCAFSYAESHPGYCRAVEKRFGNAGLSQRILERHQGPYQRFIPRYRYGLILSIHSWYSFAYDSSLLRRTLEALSPGGIFVLTITSNEDFFFRNALKQQNFSAEDLSQWATGQGFEHEQHMLRMPVPGSVLVSGDALTEDAKGTIGFLKGKLWQKIPAAERQQIERRFREAAQQGEVERVYGLLQFRKPVQP